MRNKKFKNLILLFVVVGILSSSLCVYAANITEPYTFAYYWPTIEYGAATSKESEVTFRPDWTLDNYREAYRNACRERDAVALTDPLYASKIEEVEKVIGAWDYYIQCLNNFGVNSDKSILIPYGEDEQILFDPKVSETYYINNYYYSIARRDMRVKEYEYYKAVFAESYNINLYNDYITGIRAFENENIKKAIHLYNYYLLNNAGL